MKRILIVEDDIVQLEFLRKCIGDFFKNSEIIGTSSFEVALNTLKDSLTSGNYFSLFALDLQLSPDKTDRGGFKLADFIRNQKCYYKTPILFLTSVTNEVMYAVSNYHCYNYLPKPYSEEEILKQLEQLCITGYVTNDIYIKDVNQVAHSISPENITFLETDKHNLLIHTNTVGVINTHSAKISDIIAFTNERFIRCHKRYTINTRFINSYDNCTNTIEIDHNNIPVGRTYKPNIQQYINEVL